MGVLLSIADRLAARAGFSGGDVLAPAGLPAQAIAEMIRKRIDELNRCSPDGAVPAAGRLGAEQERRFLETLARRFSDD